jgi:hypothetical protein
MHPNLAVRLREYKRYLPVVPRWIVLPFTETDHIGRRCSSAEGAKPSTANLATWRGIRAASRHHCSLVLAGALLMLASCASHTVPAIPRPSGQQLETIASSGLVGSTPWQAEVVKDGNKHCTQAVVAYRIMATECDYVVTADLPLNFEIEGNDQILFLDGVVSSAAARLSLVTEQNPAGMDLALVRPRGEVALRYFGYAIAPDDAQDLIVYDAAGRQIYSGGAKLRGTRDDENRPSRSSSARAE